MVDLKMLEEKTPILKEICSEKEVFWKNPDKTVCGEAMEQIELGMEDVEDAERRLERFAPFIMKCFPETKERNGIIESVLTPVPMLKCWNSRSRPRKSWRSIMTQKSPAKCS